MLIEAEMVVTMEGAVWSPGGVRVEGNRIVAVGPELEAKRGEEVVELPGQILAPGLINGHCHLDYTGFKGAIFRGKSFPDWIRAINALKQGLTPGDYLAAIAEGFEMLQRSGCTTVLNIEAFPGLFLEMKRPALRTWWFLELIDVRTRLGSDEMLAGALAFFGEHGDWPGGLGLSPHAPYTASIELYRLARQCGEELKMPWTTHLAESIEEQEMFLHGAGGLYELLEELGRDMSDCGQGSAFSHLVDHGVLNERCLLVHLNYLQEYDWRELRSRRYHVVHCPKCHAYFGHARFPLERLIEAGVNVCLGTDSLASNDTLDLRAEIRAAQKVYPEFGARAWLEMVTVNPAEALGLRGQLGVIRPGALADLVAFPVVPSTGPYTAIIRSEEPPTAMWVDGVRVV
ncbi:MAG: amidohydrolase family protein [Verrucomicrobiia bacterium]